MCRNNLCIVIHQCSTMLKMCQPILRHSNVNLLPLVIVVHHQVSLVLYLLDEHFNNWPIAGRIYVFRKQLLDEQEGGDR